MQRLTSACPSCAGRRGGGKNGHSKVFDDECNHAIRGSGAFSRRRGGPYSADMKVIEPTRRKPGKSGGAASGDAPAGKRWLEETGGPHGAEIRRKRPARGGLAGSRCWRWPINSIRTLRSGCGSVHGSEEPDTITRETNRNAAETMIRSKVRFRAIWPPFIVIVDWPLFDGGQ